ncbi:MAG: hypothetical protein M1438_18290 [Deltaproteobacteria bacterium]|nr:hypothetical protein [Deltaproteobacteria bacterium]
MGRLKDPLGFKSGFQESSALLQQWLGRVAGWRLLTLRMGCLGREPLPYARLSGPYGKRLVK